MRKPVALILISIFVICAFSSIAEDTDGDGIDDVWEARNFGNISQRGTDDFDSDGKSNLEEYEDNSDPLAKENSGFLYFAAVALVVLIAVLFGIIILARLKKR